MTTQQYAMRIAIEGDDAIMVAKKVEDALEQAGVKGKVAFDRTTSATQKQIDQLKRLADSVRADIDPMHAAQVKLNADMERYAMLAQKGALSTEELAKAQVMARKRFEETAAAVRVANTPEGMQERVLSRGEIRNSRLNLTRQGADVFTTAAMGMNPGMIAIQQGPQILDALATSGIKLTAAMGLTAAAVVAVGAAVVVLGGDAMRTEKDLRTFEAALSANADAADYQAAKLALQARGFDAMGASAEQARGMIKVFLNESLNPTRLDEFGRTSLDMAKVLGVDVVQAAQKTSKAFTGTYDDIKALDKELNFLTFSERNQIKAMYDSGNASDARNKAFEIFSEKYAKAYNDSLTEADKLTRSLSGAWDSLVESLGNTALVEGATEKIGELVGKLGDWLDQYAKVKSLSDDGLAKEQERLLKSIYSEQGQKNYETRARVEAVAANYLPPALRPVIKPRTADELRAIDRERLTTVTGQMESRRAPSVGDTLETDSERALKEKADADEAAAKKAASAAKSEANRAESLRRQIEAMKANTAGTFDLAKAYLVSDAAALEAEASMRGLTEQTRKGGDATAIQAAQQRFLSAKMADTALAGAKSVVQMEKEAAQIEFISKAMNEQGMSRARANEAAEKQSMLAPLIALKEKAVGDELKILTEIIDRLTQAQDNFNESRRKSRAEQATEGNQEAIRLMKLELDLIKETSEARAIALARDRQKADLGYKPDEVVTKAEDVRAIDSAGERVSQDFVNSRAEYIDQQRRDHEDAVALMQTELEYRGLNSRQISRMLALKEVELDLDRRGIKAASDEGQKILNNVRYQQDMLDVIERQRDAQSQAEGVQKSLFDDIKSNIREGKIEAEDFGDALVTALRRAAQEALIMSAINPFQNWLTGSNESTDAGGFLQSLFSRGKSSSGGGSSGGLVGRETADPNGTSPDSWWNTGLNVAKSIFGFASGTESAPGGPALVGEDDYELILGPKVRNLAKGATVKNHAASRSLIQDIAAATAPTAAVSAPPQYFTFDLRGAVVTEDLLQQMNSIAENKAAEITKIGLDQMDQALPDRVQQIQNDPRHRR